MRRRLFSILICLVLCLSLLPAAALAADGTEPVPLWLTYNGEAQELITAGTADGGTMQYALGSSHETAPTTGWSDEIPTATDAGTYHVWYKVKGDADQGDSDPVCVDAVIEKAWLKVKADNLTVLVGSELPAPTYTITGFVGNDTADVVTGTPVLTFDPTPDLSAEGSYFINVDISGMSADNYDFESSSGALMVRDHVHNFTGHTLGTTNAVNDTILATCDAEGCTAYTTPAAIVTIYAPEDAVYVSGLWHTASLTYDEQVDPGEISYGDKDPVDAGTYTASVTCDGVTASVTYEVAKRPLTVTADDKTAHVGDGEPAYTYTVTGWEENYDEEYGDRVTGVTAVCEADMTKAGAYGITISGAPTVEDYEGSDVTANYAITTVDGTLTVSGESCDGVTDCPSTKYTDLDTTLWYHEAVDYALANELMNGMTETEFAPNGTLTRAQVVTILWRMEGEPVVNYAMDFADAAEDQWYAEAVRWAASEKIVEGYDGKFNPNDPVTREQFATMLYRYEQMKGGGFEGAWAFRLDFPDLADLSDWAFEAVSWCVMHEIMGGHDDGRLDPQGTATRAQAAQMLMDYLSQ